MKQFEDINSPSAKRLIALIVFSFLVTFAISRLTVYLVLGHFMPNFFLTVKGVHIHHFTYGVVLLVLVGLYLILVHPRFNTRVFRIATVVFGIGLGLTFDEFGMWVRLNDSYWVRQSYDAIVIVLLSLLSIAYFKDFAKIVQKEIVWLGRFFRHLLKNK